MRVEYRRRVLPLNPRHTLLKPQNHSQLLDIPGNFRRYHSAAETRLRAIPRQSDPAACVERESLHESVLDGESMLRLGVPLGDNPVEFRRDPPAFTQDSQIPRQ